MSNDGFSGALSEDSKVWLRNAIKAGATVAGGAVPHDFQQGWAHRITFKSPGMTAHYFTRERGFTYDEPGVVFSALSECGLVGWHSQRVPLMLPGTMPYCQRCEAKLLKRSGRG